MAIKPHDGSLRKGGVHEATYISASRSLCYTEPLPVSFRRVRDIGFSSAKYTLMGIYAAPQGSSVTDVCSVRHDNESRSLVVEFLHGTSALRGEHDADGLIGGVEMKNLLGGAQTLRDLLRLST